MRIFFFFFLIYLFYLFIFGCVGSSLLRTGFSLVVESGGFSLSWLLLLRSTGSRRSGSVVVAHGLSRSAACGIFLDQGSNPCPLHWQADSFFLKFFFFNYYLFIYLFIYFWLCWILVSVQGLPLAAASGGHSSSRCAGLTIVAFRCGAQAPDAQAQ